MKPDWKKLALEMETDLERVGASMVRLDGKDLNLERDTVDISPSHRVVGGKATRHEIRKVFWEMRNEPRMKRGNTLLWGAYSELTNKTILGTAAECTGIVAARYEEKVGVSNA